MSEQTKTKPPVKRFVKSPDSQLHNSDQSWKARVSRMKTVRSENIQPLPKKNKLTVGDLFNKKKETK